MCILSFICSAVFLYYMFGVIKIHKRSKLYWQVFGGRRINQRFVNRKPTIKRKPTSTELKAQLKRAINRENYEEAGRIQKKLKNHKPYNLLLIK